MEKPRKQPDTSILASWKPIVKGLIGTPEKIVYGLSGCQLIQICVLHMITEAFNSKEELHVIFHFSLIRKLNSDFNSS